MSLARGHAGMWWCCCCTTEGGFPFAAFWLLWLLVTSAQHAHARRLSDQRVELVGESGTVTSMSLSPCQHFLTTNLADNCVHLWQLPPGLGGQQGTVGGYSTNGLAGGLGSGSGSPCGGAFQHRQGPACDPFDALPSAPLLEFRMADAR